MLFKQRAGIRRSGVLAAVFVLVAAAQGLAAVAWKFDYQGELKNSGLPVNGATDMVFRLYDAASAGNQVGATVTATDVMVSDGVFTIELDFTNGGTLQGVYNGNERWLQVTVEGTPLTPRQRLSPAPNAIIAQGLALPYVVQEDEPYLMHMVSTADIPQVRALWVTTTTADTGAIAIMGESVAGGNSYNVGVYGVTGSGNGFGVVGANTSPAGNCTGVYGANESNSGYGVIGWAHSPSGVTTGVEGRSESTTGTGIHGWANAGTGVNYGVRGTSDSPSGWAGYFDGRGFFSGAVGIRTVGNPGAMLHISGAAAATGLALNANDQLYVHALDDFVGVGRSTQVTGAETFGVRSVTSGNNYGGMYMETSTATGKPFYGYAANGVAKGWTYFDALDNAWRLNIGGSDRLHVAGSSGDFGVKRVPLANDLEVEGTASKTVAGSWLANSDARIKTGVETVENALDTLERVRLVRFHYTDDYRAAHPEIEDRSYLNVIAQEFREVFPDHVKGSGERLANGDEILQVDTYPLTIYTARAVQELNAKLEERDAQLAVRESEIHSLTERLAQLEILVESLAMERGVELETAAYSDAR